MDNIIVFGLGAIGSNLLLQLTKLYSKNNFWGIDYDKVEDRNINTQAYLLPHIGIYKAQAMRIILGMNIRKFNYLPQVTKVEKNDVLINKYKDNKDFLFVDCFDNTESRQLLEGIDNCLHIGFSPTYTAEIIWGKQYSAPQNINPEENDICELTYAVPFINYVVSLATMSIQDYIEKNETNNYIIIDKFKIRKL